ncbi:PH domain-containing protein [Micromonospora sp. NPDC050417]|uniref:PH domain-containing protein n=1 Tax=Micromonospora sp. NPDC050417 TaxID=3364280 RepID=UPI0037905C7C
MTEPPLPGNPAAQPQPTEPSAAQPQAVEPPAAQPQAVEPRKRLHPLSPLLHGANSLVVIIAALSWQTLGRVGIGWYAALVTVLLVGVVVLSLVSWYNTGYHVVGRELRIHEGLLWRRTRAIPLERLQSVEVVRPLLAQLSGLAELRLEVVGGGKTEAPLAYVAVADAVALRERLLSLAARTPLPKPSGDGRVETPVPVELNRRHLLSVANRDLLVSQLLTPQALLLPFGLAFVLFQFLSEGSWSFIAVASTLTAMAGVLLQPLRRVLADWNFQLGRDEAGLRVRHGLLETRAQTVPLDRVQAVGVTWPLLWRLKGWLRLRLEVAGFSTDADAINRADQLMPVGDLGTAQRIMAEVLPGVDLTMTLPPPPRRARWVHPLAQPVLGAGLGEQVFAVRHGLLTRQLVVVPYARIQSVRVVQGPLQRRLRLATVHADTAGGPGAAAQDRDITEAWALAAELTARARAARTPR